MLLDQGRSTTSCILEIRIRRIPVQHVRKLLPIPLLQQVLGHIHVIVHPVEDLRLPLKKIFPFPDLLQQPLRIQNVWMVVPFVREGLDLVHQMLHRLHTRTAMPRRVVELQVRLSHAQVVRLDGIFEAVEEGCLGMSPLLATVEPLEAVVVEMATEGDARWEGAVAECGKGTRTGNFVNVADDEDVALGRRLFAGQGGEGLSEEGVTSETFVLPGIACGES